MTGAKIIVVEDDADLRSQVVDFLSLSGFHVTGVGSAAEFYRRMSTERFSLVVLDLHLPDEDGLAISTHLRDQPDVGVIIVTAKDRIDDRVRGFEAGADIYLVKPVDLRELVAAAQSLIRRIGHDPAPPTPEPDGKAEDAEPSWRYDPAGFALVAPNGRPVKLTANEVQLLNRLTARHKGVASRGELLGLLGYDPGDPNNRNLDAALRRLRLKVDDQTGEALPLRTVHGVGYLLEQDFHIVRAADA